MGYNVINLWYSLPTIDAILVATEADNSGENENLRNILLVKQV